MQVNRRDFLRRGAVIGSAVAFGPQVFLRPLLARASAAPRNLVVVELIGGNDGLNTLVPFGLNGGAYYGLYRKTIGVPEGKLLKVGGQPVAFHPALAPLKNEFDAGRLAVIHGVSGPMPSFSHTGARRIWLSGDPSGQAGEGWLGRHLAQHPAPPFPSAAELFPGVTQLTAGAPSIVPAIQSLSEFHFPVDPLHPEESLLRRTTFASLAASAQQAGGSLAAIGGASLGVLELIDGFATVPPASGPAYPNGPFADALKTAARLLASGLGLRLFHLGLTGFDTHTEQDKTGNHSTLLSRLASGLAAFRADLLVKGIESDTLVMVFTEFGRTVFENAGGGTDHGTVAPVLVMGSGVHGGFVNAHPSLDPAALTAQDHELAPQADFRDVIGSLLMGWLGESPSAAAEILHGYQPADLGFVK